MFDPLKIGLYIILFIPGFIFVQTKEHHLLREKIPQFEKTLNIILWSAIIWVIAFILPIIPLANNERAQIIGILNNFFSNNNINKLPGILINIKKELTVFFLIVCFWTFILSNIYGLIRKWKYFDVIIKWFTGRDWYPSVNFRFYEENINKAIEIKSGDNRYIGILYSAPDTKEDKYIIITKPYIILEKKIEELSIVDYIMIKIDEIDEIKAYTKNILKNLGD